MTAERGSLLLTVGELTCMYYSARPTCTLLTRLYSLADQLQQVLVLISLTIIMEIKNFSRLKVHFFFSHRDSTIGLWIFLSFCIWVTIIKSSTTLQVFIWNCFCHVRTSIFYVKLYTPSNNTILRKLSEVK